jgi:hypothetical protein
MTILPAVIKFVEEDILSSLTYEEATNHDSLLFDTCLHGMLDTKSAEGLGPSTLIETKSLIPIH